MAPADHGHDGQDRMCSRSALLDHLDAPTATTVARLLSDGNIGMLQIRSVGAAVADTPADATAYAHRTQNFALSAVVNESRLAPSDQTWAELDSHAIYLGFQTNGDPNAFHTHFPIPPTEPLPDPERDARDETPSPTGVGGYPRPQPRTEE